MTKTTATTVCPGCGKPLTHNHPKASVWHLACLMAATAHLRK